MAKLPKSVGFGMGLEFRESTCMLNAKNASLVKPGMVFNVSVGALWCSDCERVHEFLEALRSCCRISVAFCALQTTCQRLANHTFPQ